MKPILYSLRLNEGERLRRLLGGLTGFLVLFPAGLASPLAAQEEDLEKQIQNPVASLISVPFQNNIDTGIGAFDRSRNTLNIQPVYPVSLGNSAGEPGLRRHLDAGGHRRGPMKRELGAHAFAILFGAGFFF